MLTSIQVLWSPAWTPRDDVVHVFDFQRSPHLTLRLSFLGPNTSSSHLGTGLGFDVRTKYVQQPSWNWTRIWRQDNRGDSTKNYCNSWILFLPGWYNGYRKDEGRVKSGSLAYNRRKTREKRPLGRNPDRSWCLHHTCVKLLLVAAHGPRRQHTSPRSHGLR